MKLVSIYQRLLSTSEKTGGAAHLERCNAPLQFGRETLEHGRLGWSDKVSFNLWALKLGGGNGLRFE